VANDVKWIKLATNLFEDEKTLLIESMPNGHIIIIIWIKLLCQAGKQNNSGVFMLKNGIPYTEKMLATIFRLDEATVSNALNIFESFDMIQIVNDVITITNWGKHQNLDKIEAYNEYQRNYMKKYRLKQKEIATGKEPSKTNGNINPNPNYMKKYRLKQKEIATGKEPNKTNGNINPNPNPKSKFRSADIELDIDLDLEKDINVDSEVDTDKNIDLDSDLDSDKSIISLDYDFIIKTYHAICKSLPKVVKLTDSRKMAMDAADKTLDGILFEQLFEKIENSDFLAGRVTTTNWRATFDWIMKPENIVKILSGMYDNRKPTANAVNYSDTARYKNLKMEE